MTFQNLESGHQCRCLEGSVADFKNLFVRRVSKASELKDRDFRTKHEKGKEPPTENNCQKICGNYRSISIDIWNEESKDIRLDHYTLGLLFAPKWKNNLAVIRFGNDTGFVKHTPINEESTLNPFHYDFYKCDTFELKNVELLEMIPLNRYVPNQSK